MKTLRGQKLSQMPGYLWSALSQSKHRGVCPVCTKRSIFVNLSDWQREHCRCIRCNSSSRGRALTQTLIETVPDWKQKTILEFAPHGAVSGMLETSCSGYKGSVFLPDVTLGSEVNGRLNQDLRALTLADESYDIVISQDVFEHVFEPEKAFAELGRILKPGGVHIFTLPFNRHEKTRPRAVLNGEQVQHLLEPEYHGDPVNPSGTLVVTNWGYDICDLVFEASGMQTTYHSPQNEGLGIVGENLEVFVSKKPRPGRG